jgi:hypothetical protein
MTLLAAVVAVGGAFGAMAGTASAIVVQEDGQWCGIDEPQPLPQLESYLRSYHTQHHYSDCTQADRVFFDSYHPQRTAKIVKFRIHDTKFLKELFVGRKQYIGSADIGRKPRYTASEMASPSAATS